MKTNANAKLSLQKRYKYVVDNVVYYLLVSISTISLAPTIQAKPNPVLLNYIYPLLVLINRDKSRRKNIGWINGKFPKKFANLLLYNFEILKSFLERIDIKGIEENLIYKNKTNLL